MWHATKYAIPFNVFIVLYIFILYGEVGSWEVFPVGGLVLLFIDILYFRTQDLARPSKPNLSLYTVAAIFLIGALSAPFNIIKDHIPLLVLAALSIPAFIGAYSLRVALRIQKQHAPTKPDPGIQLSPKGHRPII